MIKEIRLENWKSFPKATLYLDPLTIWTEKVGSFATDAALLCEEGWKAGAEPTKVDARAMSDGTLRFLAILTALLTIPERSQLIIEEVDNGLHPSRSDILINMLRTVMILDTSVLCVWLKVPGKETCGSGASCLDFTKVDGEIQTAIQTQYTLVLPLASIIETGNHIAQAAQWRYERATALAELIAKAADQATPWAAFNDQQLLRSADGLKSLAAKWPNLAAQELSIGDATISEVADHCAKMGYKVEIYSGDQGLREHYMATVLPQPRRRKRTS